MDPKIRDLCKRLVLVARRHPSGEAWVKNRAREALRSSKDLCGPVEINRAVARGRRAVRDAEEFARFAKYRALRRRYPSRTSE